MSHTLPSCPCFEMKITQGRVSVCEPPASQSFRKHQGWGSRWPRRDLTSQGTAVMAMSRSPSGPRLHFAAPSATPAFSLWQSSFPGWRDWTPKYLSVPHSGWGHKAHCLLCAEAHFCLDIGSLGSGLLPHFFSNPSSSSTSPPETLFSIRLAALTARKPPLSKKTWPFLALLI